MKAPQPFDGDNTAAFQHRHRRAQRSFTLSSHVARTPHKRGPAVRAGDRLGVKTAVGRIAVLGFTRPAERERRHCRGRAVVGHGADNGKPRPAVGAVDKRIAIAAFAWVAHLSQTRRAGRGIGDNLGVHRPGPAVADGKVLRHVRPGKRLRFHAINACQRRAVLMQPRGKGPPITREAHQHALSVIADVTGQLKRLRQLPDEGTKPHALHLAAHPQLNAVAAHTVQNSSDDEVSNAARRRFSALICSSLSRSTQTSACVGQASIQAGPASRW